MRRIVHDGDPGLVRALDWPRRRDPKVAREFDRLLTKGRKPAGSPHRGHLRAACRRRGHGDRAVPARPAADVERTLAKTFTEQNLGLRLATDAAFLQRARRMLATG